MNSLREARQRKQLTLNEVSSLTKLTIPHLSWIETGKTVPNLHTKIRLQRIFGDIDFLVVDDRSVASDYISCEYQFRYLIRMLRGLPEAEQKQFCISAVKHLNKLK